MTLGRTAISEKRSSTHDFILQPVMETSVAKKPSPPKSPPKKPEATELNEKTLDKVAGGLDPRLRYGRGGGG